MVSKSIRFSYRCIFIVLRVNLINGLCVCVWAYHCNAVIYFLILTKSLIRVKQWERESYINNLLFTHFSALILLLLFANTINQKGFYLYCVDFYCQSIIWFAFIKIVFFLNFHWKLKWMTSALKMVNWLKKVWFLNWHGEFGTLQMCVFFCSPSWRLK